MNQKKQLIILLMLIAVMTGLGIYSYGPSKKGAGAPTTGEPEASAEQASPPSSKEMEELANWLPVLGTDGVAKSIKNSQVFGLQEVQSSGQGSTTGTNLVVPASAPFVAPPRLEGTLRQGKEHLAIINGETYRVGQTVRNTTYVVTKVDSSTVALKSLETDDLLVLDLLK